MTGRSAVVSVLAYMLCGEAVHAQKIINPATRLDGTEIQPAEIERTVTRLMQTAGVPGLAVAILNEGEIVYLNSFGYRNVERRLPLTTNTVMYSASFTKSVFAYVVMQLVETGQIGLDVPIYHYLDRPLSAFDVYKDLATDPRWRRITARMLLSHTSGLPNSRGSGNDRRLHIYFEPGTRYAYSGEGITLLQFVVERITGRPAAELVDELVFDRFGMSRSGMVWKNNFESDYANGYDEVGKDLGHARRRAADASYTMDTTIFDFAKFTRGVLLGEGLSEGSRDLMLRPQIRIWSRQLFPTLSTETTAANDPIRLSAGLGWGIFKTPYGKAFFKEGIDDGAMNHWVCFDERKTCLGLMSNSSNAGHIFKELLEKLIADRYTPWFWENYIPIQALATNRR